MENGWLTRLREIVRASPQEMALLAAMAAIVAGSSVFVALRTAEPAPAAIEKVRGHRTSSPSPDAVVLVHVAGLVKSPGVYQVPLGSRVKDAIAAAGGAVEGADLNSLNLAAIVSDGEKVLVTAAGGPATASEPGSTNEKVNLNSATQAQLEELPGVGPVLAERIIAYRTKKRFTAVRQLMEVDGFGPKKFESLKDLVTV